MQTSQNFFEFPTKRPVAILMIVLGITVFGWISYQQLPQNLMPDISYPKITVRTEYPGSAPEEVENTITVPVEQALGIVDNLVRISSISQAENSDVILEFGWDTDMYAATAEVREKLDHVFLPEESKRPLILRYDPGLDPVIRFGLHGDQALAYLRYLAEIKIQRVLETVDGVAAVKVIGGLEEEIHIAVDEQKLTLIGINIDQIRNRLSQENINLAGGNIKEGETEFIVRTLNEFKSIQDIESVVIGSWNNKEVFIQDVAQVQRTPKEREVITRINGLESVELEIYKEADVNIVQVAQRVSNFVFGTAEQQAYVKAMRAEQSQEDGAKKKKGRGDQGPQGMMAQQMTNYIAYNLPEGTTIEKLTDQSIFIRNAVNNVQSTAILGGLLAIFMLFLFLRQIKSTLIAAVSIPVSVIATFVPLKLFDVSLNIMSLGGLALGIGMLVDNSIVVLESIARCREEGDDLVGSVIRGVREVAAAVTASTFTTVAVFFPIVFVEGVAGQIFGDLAITVIFSLLASLAVALFLIPMLASRQQVLVRDIVSKPGKKKRAITVFRLEKEITASFEELDQKNGLTKILTGIRLFAALLSEIVTKIFLLWISFLFVFGSFLLIFILFLVVLLFRLGNGLGISNKLTVQWLLDFGARTIMKYAPRSDLEDDFFKNRALTSFFDDCTKVVHFWRKDGQVRSIFRFLIVPFGYLFFFLQFIVFYVIELVQRLFHTLSLSIGILLKGMLLAGSILLTPPTRFCLTLFHTVYGAFDTYYPTLLRSSLNKKRIILSAATILFVASVVLLGPQLGRELIPTVHQGEFNVDLTFPVGTDIVHTANKALDVEQLLLTRPQIETIASVVGSDKSAVTESDRGEHTAKVTVKMKPVQGFIQAEEKLIESIRQDLGSYTGFRTKISRPVLFSFKNPIEIEVQGYNLDLLKDLSAQIVQKIEGIEGLFDVTTTMQPGNPEIQVIYDRLRLAQAGLNVREVAEIVRTKVLGNIATEYKEEDRKIDIRVSVRKRDIGTVENLRRLVINPYGKRPIPLEAVADITINEGPGEIRRIEQQRTVIVRANVSGRDLHSVSEEIYNSLKTISLPGDFGYTVAGQNEEMATSLRSLIFALSLSIFLVYIVMASLFESLVYPFVIIFTIPLGLIGIVVGLYLLQIPVSIVVLLGAIVLTGIVVNNAIVLVDYINQLKLRGYSKYDAIVAAGKARLRPIIMTTSTTVLGLLPMALGWGAGTEIRTPMAITVIIGLISSSILTLVIIPLVYSLFDSKHERNGIQ